MYRIVAQYTGEDGHFHANADPEYALGPLADKWFDTREDAQAALEAMDPEPAVDAVHTYFVESWDEAEARGAEPF